MQKISSFLASRSEFSRHVTTLLTGTTIAQLIPILISPVLTRIYSPSEFGVFAFFFVFCTILGGVSNLKFDMAIMLSEDDKEAEYTAKSALVISMALSLLVLLIIILFHSEILSLFDEPDLEGWLYVIPFMMLLIGLFNVLNYYNSRMKQYRLLAKANIIKAIVLSASQLIFGLFTLGASGLIAGYLLAGLVAYTFLTIGTLKELNIFSQYELDALKTQAVKFSSFAKLTAPGSLINSSAQHLSSIFISSLFSIATLGHYHLVQRVLGVPSSLLGSAISQVYYQQASKEYNETGVVSKTFNMTLKRLALVGIILYGPLYLVVEDLFAFVFGEDWRVAGVYSKILLPMFMFRFIGSPLTFTFIVQQKQKYLLVLDCGLLVIVFAVFFTAKIGGLDSLDYLKVLSALISVAYVLVIIVTIGMANHKGPLLDLDGR